MANSLAIYQDIVLGTTVDISLAPLDRFPASGGRLRLYAAAETIASLRVTLMFGTDAVMDRGWVPLAAAAGRVIVPDDLIAEGIGAPHDPITMRVENPTAANCELYAKIVIETP